MGDVFDLPHRENQHPFGLALLYFDRSYVNRPTQVGSFGG
jgi:hypothetical protein